MAQRLLEFIEKSPTSYHTVKNVIKRLEASHFKELSIKSNWNLKCGQRYYISINRSTIIAFAIGGKYQPGNGISIIATHTDSPCLKLKPNHDVQKSGYNSLLVQTYGSGLWESWLDCDLTLAGISTLKSNDGMKSALFHIDRPILKIPRLAIHMTRTIQDDKFNNETHLVPILGYNTGSDSITPTYDLISTTLGVQKSDIISMDICVVGVQPPCLGGLNNEFVFSPRLDNLFNVSCSLEAFLMSFNDNSLENEPHIRMIVSYDHEECGSQSYAGAQSSSLPNIIQKMLESLGGDYTTVINNSFVLSADQAHAVHPNYPNKHEDQHRTDLNGGVVIKHHCNQRYATNVFTASVVKLICSEAKIPFKEFVVRNDMPCGSTIGPIVSSHIGIKTVDVGFPMLSMHSIRETCAVASIDHAITFFKEFFYRLPKIMKDSEID